MQTGQIIFRNIFVYAYLYIHITTINEKASEKVEREQGAYMGWFGRKKGKKKYSNYKLNNKMKNAKQE